MASILSILLLLIVYGGSIAVILYFLGLIARFVRAHERIAGSVEEIARRFRGGNT